MNTTGKFQAYDYGKERNLVEYGSEEPINFLENYDKIDIPIHIIYSTNDNIIPEECILKHYEALIKRDNKNLTHLTKVDNIGHNELTLSSNSKIIRHILNVILN
jgi:pimeloyl-ACP methyl ester carboxylesterase